MNSATMTAESGSTTVLKQIRAVALLVAVMFALPAAAFPDHSIMFVTLGAATGILICVYLEIQSERKAAEETEQTLLAGLPPEFEGLASFKDLVLLELKQDPPAGQLELPTIGEAQPEKPRRKTASIVRSLEGKDLYLIDCDGSSQFCWTE